MRPELISPALPISSTAWNGLPSNVSEESFSALLIEMLSSDS
jgi:hypothetical protein